MINSYMPEGSVCCTAENAEFVKSETGLYQAMKSGKILESVAMRCNQNLDLTVDLHGVTGIIPKEEAVFDDGVTPFKDIAVISRVGKPVCFKVLDIIEENGIKKAYLSRKAAQKECIDNYLSKLIPGDVIGCKITHTERFGAFADVGCGVIALLPIDCISVSRIAHSSDRLRADMKLRCVVKSVQKEPFKLFLTLKELLGTWEENAAAFAPGQTVRGIVRGVEPYGVFIEIAPNLSGLSEYRDDLSSGDEAAVFIKSIDADKMKVKLVVVGVSGKAETSPLTYFTDKNVTHIYKWIYSTPESKRLIETDFQSL